MTSVCQENPQTYGWNQIATKFAKRYLVPGSGTWDNSLSILEQRRRKAEEAKQGYRSTKKGFQPVWVILKIYGNTALYLLGKELF